MDAIASRLGSPRFVRRLSWVSVLVLFAGVIAFSIAYFSDTAEAPSVAPTGGPVQVESRPPTVKLDPTAREVAGEFIVTAVTRQNLAQAWKITHPELRAGYTYKQWLTGNIPVQVYPANAIGGASFKVNQSHPNEAVLDVLIFPKPGSGVNPQSFFIGLKAVGKGKNRRWLVNYFVPSSGARIVPDVGQ